MKLTTAHVILPPTRAFQALYTDRRVSPVVRQPTNRIMSPKPPIQPPTMTKVNWTDSNHSTRKWKTSMNICLASATPLYIVPQKTPTPARHMIVATWNCSEDHLVSKRNVI